MYTLSDFPTLSKMQPISLEQMSAVSLMNRTDTKFVTTGMMLSKVLEDAFSLGYRVCEISGERIMAYSSIYYDTDNLRMFYAHRNQKLVRQKVRIRTYLENGDTFLEIKNKNNHRRTKKKRIQISSDRDYSNLAGEDVCYFIRSKTAWQPEELSPETTTDFQRITLVDKDYSERITIDLNLCFNNFRSSRHAELGPLVIIELKQDGMKRSPFKNILIKHRIFPYRISKYCIAVTLTEPSARCGRFKEKVRHIEKLIDRKLI